MFWKLQNRVLGPTIIIILRHSLLNHIRIFASSASFLEIREFGSKFIKSGIN